MNNFLMKKKLIALNRPEAKQKLYDHGSKRSVDQLTLNDEYITTFGSIKEAVSVTMFPKCYRHIIDCCRGHRKSTAGFHWRYTPESEKI